MSRKKSTITPEERKLKEMCQVLLHLGLQSSNEQELKRLQKEESEKFNTIKTITDKFLPEYATNKRIRNIYKLELSQVKPIAEMFDIRILSEEVLKTCDLAEKEILDKYRKTDEERMMSDDAFRYLILSDGRFSSFTTEPDDKVLVHGGFLMDPSRSRCYPMGSPEAKSLLDPVILNRAKPSDRQKSKYTTKEEALQIQTHRSELLALFATPAYHPPLKTSSSSSSSEEETDHKKKKKEKREKREKKKEKKRDKKRERVKEEPGETVDQNKRIKLEVEVEPMSVEVKQEVKEEMEIEVREKQRVDDWWIENMVKRGLL